MAKQSVQVSWQVLLDEANWQDDPPQPLPDEDRPGHGPSLRRWRYAVAAIAVTLLGLAMTFWLLARRELATVQQDIELVLERETGQDKRQQSAPVAMVDWETDPGWRIHLQESIQAQTNAGLSAQVERVEVQGVWTLAALRVSGPNQPLPWHETRFYRETADGWLRTGPVEQFWGDWSSQEGTNFTFRYRQRDRAAALAAAATVEEEYARLRSMLGLPAVRSERVVEVRPDVWQMRFDYEQGKLLLPSPEILPVPEGVTSEAALSQAVLLYYINELVREAFDRYGYGEHWIWSNLTESGLRNWLILEGRTALQSSAESLLPWLLITVYDDSTALPATVAADCQLLQALRLEALLFPCDPAMRAFLVGPPALLGLADLRTTYEYDSTRDASAVDTSTGLTWRTETRQELATMTALYVYAVDAYGLEQMPRFLGALGQQRGWDAVLATAFGTSAQAFETDWQQWMRAGYSVPPSPHP